MNSLPQELVDQISSHLEYNDHKNTLLLSSKFQRAAEKHSDAFSTYALTEENANAFVDFCGGRLAQHLRSTEFRTSLSALQVVDKDAFRNIPCRDTADELREIDEEFTRQINFLFSTLHRAEQTGTLKGLGALELKIYTPTRVVDEDKFCLHRIFTSWRVQLLFPETLPSLSSIRSLLIENGTDSTYDDIPNPSLRKLDLRILLDISDKLSNLQTLKCNIGDDEWASGLDEEEARYCTQDWPGPRRDSRHDFGKAIQTVQLPSLSHVQLDFIYHIIKADGSDQRLAVPNLVKPAIYDPFSSSLRLLSYQLRTMKLRVMADQTLFWPADGSTSWWPKLESLSVMFYIASPSGSWYFKGPRDVGAKEGSEIDETSYPPLGTTDADGYSEWISTYEFDWIDHHVFAQYRVEPNDESLVPFLTAFAKATALMPSLKEATLWAPLMFNPEDVGEYDGFDHKLVSHYTEGELEWEISYAKPGTKAFMRAVGEDFAAYRQMWWYVGRWRPDAELLGLFQSMGQEEHGGQMSEYWGDRFTSPGLLERSDFED